jgi:lysozyme
MDTGEDFLMTPKSKPQRGLDWILGTIDLKKVPTSEKVFLVGVRGYFRDSMGKKGANDRGIYDDAAFWVERDSGRIHQYNFNTDPSSYRKGRGTGKYKGMATLKCGVWLYKPGTHNGSSPHPAFRQAANVTVLRDGDEGFYEDAGMFGINIHRGGYNGTSSLGCQTVPPKQWSDFKKTGDALLKKHKQRTFRYVLIETQG